MLGKFAVFSSLPVVLGLLAGAVIPFQAVANGALGKALGHPLWAALVSLMVSAALTVISILLLRASAPNFSNATLGPWWLWIGGIGGALYVAMAAILPQKVGAGNFILYVMLGQVIAAMLIDQFGLMGITPKPMDALKLSGVAVIIAGLVMVQISSARAINPKEDSSTAVSEQNLMKKP